MPRSQTRKRLSDTQALSLLAEALADAAHAKKLRTLLQGLFTAGQRIELAQRLRLARYLSAGWSFRAIAAETGASTTTVAAVDRFLRSLNPKDRRQVLIRQRPSSPRRSLRDPFQNPHIPLSGKWLFRELTGTDR